MELKVYRLKCLLNNLISDEDAEALLKVINENFKIVKMTAKMK